MKNPLTPRVLSIRQPLAWAIVTGQKNVENRKWSTDYRGPVLIHAGKSWNQEAFEWLEEEKRLRPPQDLPMGAIVGICVLVDVVTKRQAAKFRRWFRGPYGLVLVNAVALRKPIPLKGQLGLYSASDALLRQVARQYAS